MDARAEAIFGQALQCVLYRVPRLYTLRPAGFAHALGLRYGLVGLAACHHLMLSADPREELDFETDFLSWQDSVAEHVRFELVPNLPFETLPAFPTVVGRFAAEPIYSYMSRELRLLPFEYYLEIALSDYEGRHRAYVGAGWPFWRRRHAYRLFHAASRESLEYARHFLERREADLEEVPQIALLGE